MYLQLTGKGKTLEEALAALKERREAVAAQLEKLGVDKSALVFTPPGVDDSAGAQQRRMEAMIAQRMGGRGAKKGAKPVKPPVAVTTMLTAHWPLAGDTTEKLLLAADAVREKIKAADLAGGKEAPKLSPEEQEVAEEMAAQTSPNTGGDEEQVEAGRAATSCSWPGSRRRTARPPWPRPLPRPRPRPPNWPKRPAPAWAR